MWIRLQVRLSGHHTVHETNFGTSRFIRYQVHRGCRKESFSRDSGASFPSPSVSTAHLERKVILDGVCSVASELIRMDEWSIDVVMTASQKGLGTPPGLSVLVASKRAIQVRFLVKFRSVKR